MWAPSLIKKLSKVNHNPIGENSPLPVTLSVTDNTFFQGFSLQSRLSEVGLKNRVTRCVCEKVTQNVAQAIFCQNKYTYA
jgi:hypothetical protein